MFKGGWPPVVRPDSNKYRAWRWLAPMHTSLSNNQSTHLNSQLSLCHPSNPGPKIVEHLELPNKSVDLRHKYAIPL